MSSERISQSDLARAVNAHRRALESIGVRVHAIGFDKGSKINGVSFKLYVPVGREFIGWTVREAYDNVTTRTEHVYDIARALEGTVNAIVKQVTT
jgi:hypothetical protein